ncbi:thaumatin family protein [Dictyobacter arantiisoli]|uniref:CBM56 domain-containing protein n=1 Tax=Dictyobacter arantiisoli TaxID=2014874 RepID=A0A5A5TG52_9CHLR|nr:thaumatin family protein [Dictyobacter arantiisoli]GCF10238.1 hypothetical protein KDI_38020 [Dictyobacter arantiisoli]
MKKPGKILSLLIVVLTTIATFLIVSLIPAHADSPTPPSGHTITFTNNTSETIWAAAAPNAGFATPANGGWVMDPGSTYSLTVADNWQGRFWGRTYCSFDASGTGNCETGSCGTVLQCNGATGVGPQTLAEFTLSGWGGNDFYDVSHVDGFNVPMTITPVGGAQPDPNNPYRCGVAGCGTDLNPNCPAALQDTDASGRIVGCKSACEVFGTDQYCCEGPYVGAACNPTTWPVNYAAYFKSQCPNAYSYAYDDATSTFTDTNANYAITFGPANGASPPAPIPVPVRVPVPTTPPALPPSSASSSGFNQGTDTPSSTQTLFWFQPNGWSADYVIVHYTDPNLGQQNVQMTYNSSTSRWEYTASGIDSGQGGTYSFTFSQNGQQTDTGSNSWTQGSGSAPPPPVVSASSSSSGPGYNQGADTSGGGQTLFWFQPNGWSADYVIVHYTDPNLGQQNVQMTYNSGSSRWEYTASSIGSGQGGTYSFTFSQNGQQTDTGSNSWTQP